MQTFAFLWGGVPFTASMPKEALHTGWASDDAARDKVEQLECKIDDLDVRVTEMRQLITKAKGARGC